MIEEDARHPSRYWYCRCSGMGRKGNTAKMNKYLVNSTIRKLCLAISPRCYFITTHHGAPPLLLFLPSSSQRKFKNTTNEIFKCRRHVSFSEASCNATNSCAALGSIFAPAASQELLQLHFEVVAHHHHNSLFFFFFFFFFLSAISAMEWKRSQSSSSSSARLLLSPLPPTIGGKIIYYFSKFNN